MVGTISILLSRNVFLLEKWILHNMGPVRLSSFSSTLHLFFWKCMMKQKHFLLSFFILSMLGWIYVWEGTSQSIYLYVILWFDDPGNHRVGDRSVIQSDAWWWESSEETCRADSYSPPETRKMQWEPTAYLHSAKSGWHNKASVAGSWAGGTQWWQIRGASRNRGWRKLRDWTKNCGKCNSSEETLKSKRETKWPSYLKDFHFK